MQEEVDTVMDGKTFVEYEDLSKLKYCGQVFRETLRLYPPAQATARENLDEVTVSGFHLPAHSWIIVRCHFVLLSCVVGATTFSQYVTVSLVRHTLHITYCRKLSGNM